MATTAQIGQPGSPPAPARLGFEATLSAYLAPPTTALFAEMAAHDGWGLSPVDAVPQVEATPCNVLVTVSNGQPEENVTLLVDTTYATTLALDDFGAATVMLSLPELAAGTHELQANGNLSTPGTLSFVVSGGLPTEAGVFAAPSNPAGAVERWTFTDTLTGGLAPYTLPRNPSQRTTPVPPLTFNHQPTTAPDGQMLTWEAGQSAWNWQFQGTTLDEAEYRALEQWAALNRRFWIQDHLGDSYYVTFNHFDADLRTNPQSQWVANYTMRVTTFAANLTGSMGGS